MVLSRSRLSTKSTPNSLHSNIILNCFEVEDAKYTQEGNDEPMKEDVLSPIYAVLQPGEMIAIDRAEKDLPDQFFSSRRYDLGSVDAINLIRNLPPMMRLKRRRVPI